MSNAWLVSYGYDAAEVEADRTADRVLKGEPAASPSSGAARGSSADAPESVERALASAGAPLESDVRHEMEQRFRHDFSRVRVHTGSAAEQSASEIDADAYTLGEDIVVGGDPPARDGEVSPRLLAHELTHVVQQSANPAGAMVQRQPNKKKTPKAKSKAPKQKDKQKKSAKKKAKKKPQICGRDSKKVADNFITKVSIDVGTNELTIEWDDPSKAPSGSGGTHVISPGAGKCCKNCNDVTTSQEEGSLCTPKGDSWPVSNNSKCALDGHPGAKNPTYFQRGGIAIHSGNTSSPPQSHGCARTSRDISALIHDNSVVGTTMIESSGTWSSSRCYMRASDKTPVDRADVCDGNKLKPKKPKKASVDEAPDVDRPQVALADGPGPNNDGGDGEVIDLEAEETEGDVLAVEADATTEEEPA